MKNKQKILLFIIGLTLLASLGSISQVSATSYVFGSTTHDTVGLNPEVGNLAFSLKLTPLSGTDSTFILDTFHVYVDLAAGSAKGVIWATTNGNPVLAVSSDIATGAGEQWFTFTFDDYVLSNNTEYYFGIVTSADIQTVYYDSQHTQGQYGTTANSYASPIALDNASTGFMAGYITLSSPTAPTPTPTATPGSGSHWIWNGTAWVNDDNIVETTTDLVLPLLIPLIVIIICAGLGAYFVGLWGFVLGLDVAVVLLYVALPTYMPLWGVLIVAVGNVIVLLMGRR